MRERIKPSSYFIVLDEAHWSLEKCTSTFTLRSEGPEEMFKFNLHRPSRCYFL